MSFEIDNLSETRGVFVHAATFGYPVDWNVIASTLQSYKINAVYGGFLSFGKGYYDDSPFGNQLGAAIPACHALGIKVHAAMNFFYHSHSPQVNAMKSDGTIYAAWICPVKQETRDIIKAQVEHVASNYDIDGFMYDYIRYQNIDMCYCSECRAKFEVWLGETIPDSNWAPNLGDFAPGGSRHGEFLEWRLVPMAELVRDVRGWLLAIKPDLEFSVATWTLFQNSPTYWRYFLGQDTTDWVAKGYLDMASPMMYTSNTAEIQDFIQTNNEYMIAGPEGKIPHVPLVSTGVSTPKPIAEFTAIVDTIRQAGTDGWIIWRYGGPGTGITPDIRPYLDTIALPDVFLLTSPTVTIVEGQAIISWTTTLPATTKVEYSTSPLFSVSQGERLDFKYWNIDHNEGTIIEDLTPTTNHQVELSGLIPGQRYYFRAQSKDASGIATSKVQTFVADGVVTVSITGKIVDSETTQPIEGAIVKGGAFTTVSITDGTFILNVTPATYTLTIEKAGYGTIVIPNINASTDVVLPEPVQLEPTPIFPWVPVVASLLGAGAIWGAVVR